MTKKDARKAEKELKARGLYKPYVSQDGDAFLFESYPLTARTKGVFDSQHGPMLNITVTDCSLPRIGKDPKVATVNLHFGQDTIQYVAELLIGLHPEAYARAHAQENPVK